MRLTEKQKEWILHLKEHRKSSREIAKVVGCSKSTVNNFLNGRPSVAQVKTEVVKAPKILILDLETSADIVATFGRKNVNISESNILHQGNEIISVAWKWFGEERVFSKNSVFEDFAVVPETEKDLLTTIINLLEKADAVVIHNARFDLGTIQHRMLAYRLGKIPQPKVIDTLQIARKYLKLRSNKLDAITKYFGLSNKMENEGISLWIDVQSGDPKAMERMIEYNEQDVVALSEVFKVFNPLQTSLNFGLFTEDGSEKCPCCGSDNIEKTGKLVFTQVNSFEEYLCNNCGSRSRSRKSIARDKSKLLIGL